MSVRRDLSVAPVPPAWQRFGGAMEGTVTRVVEAGRCSGSVQLGAVVPAELAAKVREFAEQDNRSVSNAIARLLEKALADASVPSGGVWEKSEIR